MAKRNKGVQIMAFLALFGIIFGIIGTGALMLFNGNKSSKEQTLTQEQYLELQKMINAQSGTTIETKSEIETLTGEIK